MASRIVPLGATSFLKASLKNPLRPVACPPCGRRLLWFRSFAPSEFLAMPVCAFILLAWVYPAAIDLAVVVLLI